MVAQGCIPSSGQTKTDRNLGLLVTQSKEPQVTYNNRLSLKGKLCMGPEE